MTIALFLAAMAGGAVLPAGTELEARLKTRVASNASRPKDPVEAVLIRPVVVGGEIAVPAGARLLGSVKAVSPIVKPDQRASLELAFTGLAGAAGKESKIEARLVHVDNARESVDEAGCILGILGSETLSARLDQAVGRVQQKYSRFGDFLQTVKSAVLKETDPEIVYEPGIEMTVTLLKPADVGAPPPAGAGPGPIEPEAALFELVNSQPLQTTTEGQGIPSDLTNLMFVGSERALEDTFRAAGWATAAQLNTGSGLETFRAIAEMRGYKEAPMSVLLLDGRKPDLVFQKQNNTFAMRHHLRIWRRAATFHGQPVWMCAATHDIGIEFSPEQRTFIHKIDSQIDRERAKVVSDLVFTGRVKALSLVARPAAPTQSRNATGDALETDGRLAVLVID